MLINMTIEKAIINNKQLFIKSFEHSVQSKGSVTFTFSCSSFLLLTIEGMSPEELL